MRLAWIAVPVLTLAASVTAPRAQHPGEDWIQQNLFPPEMVMEHQQEIGLEEAQREAIKQELKKAQARFLDVQWDLHAEVEKLNRLLQAPRVDENAAVTQAGRVMGLEEEVKKIHLALVIRIKNLLNEEQQSRLLDLRRSETPRAHPAPPHHP